MIHFQPPERGLRAWIHRRLHRRDWRTESDLFFRRQRLEIGRAVTRTISDPAIQAELNERLDQAEGQMQEKGKA